MASNLVRTDYTDFELIDYNPSNSVIVQRVKSLKPPYKNLICKGLSSFDEAENRKLKAEFEILNYIHTNLKDYTDYKKSPQIHVVSDPKIDMLVANATIAKLDAQSSSSGSGGAADGLSDNAAGTTGVVNSDIVDSNGGSVNIAPFDDMAPSLKARRPSAANVRKLQNFLNGEISGDPALRIVCPVELTMHNDIAVVFLEDIGGLSMRQYIKELKYGHDGSAYSSDMSLSGASSGGVGSGNPVEKRLLFEDFLIIALQMAEALDIIHSMGITHRDICPENIIIKKFAENIVVQLIDFNAAQIGTTETYVAASSDVIQGNLPYMSPGKNSGIVKTLCKY